MPTKPTKATSSKPMPGKRRKPTKATAKKAMPAKSRGRSIPTPVGKGRKKY